MSGVRQHFANFLTLLKFGESAGKVTFGGVTLPENVEDIGLGNVVNKHQHFAHGFLTQPTVNPTFSGNTYTRPGAGSPYTVSIDGAVSTISTDKSVAIDLTAEWLGYTQAQRYGQWFIRMMPDLTLTASRTPFDILSLASIMVDTVYCNDNGAGGYEWIPARETHQASTNLVERKEWHDAYGAKYISGFTSFVGIDANAFSLTGGEISDEGLRSVIAGTQTTGRIGYRSGSAMKFDAAGTGYAKLNAGVPQFDNAGVLTNLGGNKYGIVWIFATNRYTNAVAIITGQGEYNSVALAQAAASPTLTGFSVAEWKLCYRVIIQNFAGALKYIQADPLYNISAGPAINAGSPTTVGAGNVTTTGTYSNAQLYLTGLEAAIPVAASQAEAEAGTEVATRLFSPLRIFQAIIAWAVVATSVFKGIVHTAEMRGCKGTLVTVTPTNGQTVTIDYSATDTLYLDLINITTGNSVTLAMSNVPAAAGLLPSFTIAVKTAATVGTHNWPSGFTAPTLSASKEAWFTATTLNNGTTWRLHRAEVF